MTALLDHRIRCPRCRSGVLAGVRAADSAECNGCGAQYAAEGGFVELLEGWDERRSPAQRLMEWRPLIRIYESRLWRRSALFARAAGIAFEQECELIEQAARLQADHRVLDLACGTGLYTRRFARAAPTGSVAGLDLSIPMLQYASERAREEGLENIVLVRANALDLPFENGRFDLVNCCGALHLFPDVSLVLREIVRVLAPGGRFTLAAFRRRAGGLRERAAGLRRRMGGVDAFEEAELERLLRNAGLSEVRCLHAARAWQVVTASVP